MFNLLSVAVLLPIEIAFQFLERISLFLVSPISHNNPHVKEPEMLNALTKPLTEAIIQIDKSVLDSIASNKPGFENATLIRRVCKIVNYHASKINYTLISNSSNTTSHQAYNHQNESAKCKITTHSPLTRMPILKRFSFKKNRQFFVQACNVARVAHRSNSFDCVSGGLEYVPSDDG